MKKSQLLSYGVMVGIGTLLSIAIADHRMTLRGLAVGLSTALLAGFYEWQKAELRRQTNRILGDLKHHTMNALQVIVYAHEVRPQDQAELVREEAMRVKRAFSGAAIIGDIVPQDQGGRAAAGSREGSAGRGGKRQPQSTGQQPAAKAKGFAS